MTIPVLTAVSGAAWEAQLVQALERSDLGVTVVRRCVDVADLLATAATGTARAALVASDLRRLDREALARLAGAGLAVVGVVADADDDAAQRLRRLGVAHVVTAGSDPEALSAAVIAAVSAPVRPPHGGASDLRASVPDVAPNAAAEDAPPGGVLGRVVAVWGPTGAPGRTTVAVNLATELAALGLDTVLVDADTYGGAVAPALGLLDEAPGLAAAARLANNGSLGAASLAGVARQVGPRLRVLTGITRADRWPEIRPAAMESVLELLRSQSAYTVVDCAFCLEQDEELAFDQSAARRNGATIATLASADTVVAVGGIDSVSLQRLVRGLSELRDAVGAAEVRVVVNRARDGVVPGDVQQQVRAALHRYAGVDPVEFVPEDRAALDRALSLGQALAEAAPASPARKAIHRLARDLAGLPERRRRSSPLSRR